MKKTIISIALFALSPTIFADSFNGDVVRALFTTTIKNNEPQNEVLILENNKKNIFFFTELRNMQGRTVIHRWEYNGKVIKEKKIKVSKKRVRVSSSHSLSPKQTGKWTVVVTNDKGWPLKAAIFKYVTKGKK
ncbi:MAG: DUF2914 domain-containing protein [Gammaproteobacteria bacterium]|nr:DUF2914 domain-containing protein [Gammaproteobacteria bacterium]MDH5776765.1 DUF2914 domain-containing protein [Gammaproteobacteria bacterium]